MTASLRRSAQIAQTWIALLSASGILIHLFLRYLVHARAGVSEMPLYVAVAAGGLPLLWRLGQRLIHLEFGSDLLAGLSIVAASITGQYLSGERSIEPAVKPLGRAVRMSVCLSIALFQAASAAKA